MDLSMPKLNGLQATERIKAESPAIKVVVPTVHEDEGYLRGGKRRGLLRGNSCRPGAGPADDGAGG
jgi:DNA-binding NarL/FixJ family response regulator